MTLIFFDTNIFLDFYRMGGEAADKQLNLIDNNHDIIITGRQIEMEYKKNRQFIIFETIKKLNNLDKIDVQFPPVLIDAQPAKMIKKSVSELTRQKKIN